MDEPCQLSRRPSFELHVTEPFDRRDVSVRRNCLGASSSRSLKEVLWLSSHNKRMRISKPLLSYLRSAAEARPLCQSNGRTNPLRDSNAFSRRPLSFTQRRFARAPAEEPDFVSLVDGPAQLVRQKRRHGPGLIVLGTMVLPIPFTPSSNT